MFDESEMNELLPTDEEFRAVAENLVNFGKQIAAKGEKGIMPMAHVMCIDEKLQPMTIIVAFADFPQTHEGRARAFRDIAMQMVEKHFIPVAIVFGSEAWMSVSKDGKMPTVMPSEDPERFEVFIVQGMTMTRRHVKSIHEMRRKDDETFILVEHGKDNLVVEDGKDVEANLMAAFFIGVKDAVEASFLKDAPDVDDDKPSDNS